MNALICCSYYHAIPCCHVVENLEMPKFSKIIEDLLNCMLLSELQNNHVVLLNVAAGAAATDTVCTAQ